MADFPKRKVFISWSKRPTDEVASAFSDLLKHMFDNVQPWVSRDDIELGALSIAEIHRELAETSFGVLMVTRSNQSEPWLNFEAGSLAKTVVDGGGTRVIPLLLDMDNPGQLDRGPLANLQAEPASAEGVKKIIHLVGVTVGADRDAIDARWDAAWASFSQVLEKARAALKQDQPKVEPRDTNEILEELLELNRRNLRRPTVNVSSKSERAKREVDLLGELPGPEELFPLIQASLAVFEIPLQEVTWGRATNGLWVAEVGLEVPIARKLLPAVTAQFMAMKWPAEALIRLPNEEGELFPVRVGFPG